MPTLSIYISNPISEIVFLINCRIEYRVNIAQSQHPVHINYLLGDDLLSSESFGGSIDNNDSSN